MATVLVSPERITPTASASKYHSFETYLQVFEMVGTDTEMKLEMWVNAQRDGRPAKYRWRPLFNAAKFS